MRVKNLLFSLSLLALIFSGLSSCKKDRLIKPNEKEQDSEVTKPIEKKEAINPLTLFAEYNLAKDGNSFVNNHKNDAGGYFTGNALPGPGFTISEVKYHIPSYQELVILAPLYIEDSSLSPDDATLVNFKKNVEHYDVAENVVICGQEHKNLKSSFKTVDFNTKTAYALRFKGEENEYFSAYRYEYKDNSQGGKMLEVKAIALGEDGLTKTLDEVAKEDFWSTNSTKVVTICLPASGSNKGINVNIFGSYWASVDMSPSSEELKTGKGKLLIFDENGASVVGNVSITNGFSLRLIKCKK